MNTSATRTPTRAAVWAKTIGRCAYCGMLLADDSEGDFKREMVVDHMIPKSRGGLDSVENYAPACGSCNLAKGNRTIDEFRLFASLHLGKRVRFFVDQDEERDFVFVVSKHFFGSLVHHNIPDHIARPKTRRQQQRAFPSTGGVSAIYKSLSGHKDWLE